MKEALWKLFAVDHDGDVTVEAIPCEGSSPDGWEWRIDGIGPAAGPPRFQIREIEIVQGRADGPGIEVRTRSPHRNPPGGNRCQRSTRLLRGIGFAAKAIKIPKETRRNRGTWPDLNRLGTSVASEILTE